MARRILLILVFISGFLFETTAQDKLANRPNILIIITDDQGYADLSAFHHSAKDIKTPNMDRLADQGTLFTRAYTTAPVCSPSRAGLFTGRYQQRWGGWKFRTGLPEDEKTMSEYFKEAGYNTALIGKSDWGANYHKHNVREYPLNHGYDYFLGFSSHAHDYFLMSEEIEKTTPDPHGHSAALGRLMYNNDYKSYKEGYSTEIFTDETIRFFEANKNNEQPFMLTLSYNAVHHLIHEVPGKYLDKYGIEPIRNYDSSMGKYSKYYAKYSQYGAIPFDDMRKYYLANLDCLDDNIGRVLDKLEETGLSDNTLIVFISDNGGSPLTGAVNYPLNGSKYFTFEGGLRVPMIISWPGHYNQNEVCNSVVSALDIMPTCLEAARINIPENMDGIAINSYLERGKREICREKPLFSEFNQQAAVIDHEWKLVKSKEMIYFYGGRRQVLPSAGDQFRLFRLDNDMGEHVDLSDQYPEVKENLKKKYHKWYDEMHKEAKERGMK